MSTAKPATPAPPGGEAAEALRASEQRFRALFEHSSEVITLLAADGTYASLWGAFTGESELVA